MPIGTYTPPPLANHYTKKSNFFFHIRCILLQISHKKCFFISISILGRSGVKAYMHINFQQNRVSRSVKTVHTNLFAKIANCINL